MAEQGAEQLTPPETEYSPEETHSTWLAKTAEKAGWTTSLVLKVKAATDYVSAPIWAFASGVMAARASQWGQFFESIGNLVDRAVESGININLMQDALATALVNAHESAAVAAAATAATCVVVGTCSLISSELVRPKRPKHAKST